MVASGQCTPAAFRQHSANSSPCLQQSYWFRRIAGVSRQQISITYRLKSAVGADGRHVTLADLPPTNLRRWFPCHKACIVTTVRNGLISEAEVCKRYRLTVEELQLWQQAVDMSGIKGLRVSRANSTSTQLSRRRQTQSQRADQE
jgi:hypothetical protein